MIRHQIIWTPIQQCNVTLASQMRSDTPPFERGVEALGDTWRRSPKISLSLEFDWWRCGAIPTFLRWRRIVSKASIKCGNFHVTGIKYEVFLPGFCFWQGGKSSQSARAVGHFVTLRIALNNQDWWNDETEIHLKRHSVVLEKIFKLGIIICTIFMR